MLAGKAVALMTEDLARPHVEPSSLFASFRALTPARVGLGSTGVSQRLEHVLSFQLAHAQARDAVHARLDAGTLAADLSQVDGVTLGGPVLRLHSAAPDRPTYLQRPDLGRTLDESGVRILTELRHPPCELAVVVADGLSALAIERNAIPLITALLPRLHDWRIGPVAVVEQGRVAIADQIAALLQAEISVILIGERPGLSSPDSLGAYITWGPRPGRTDAERNCVSNIRGEGLTSSEAAAQIADCLQNAKACRLSGVALGDAVRVLAAGGTDRQGGL